MVDARLHDGRILRFPEGTDPAVIQATVKRVLGKTDKPISSPAPEGQLETESGIGDTLADILVSGPVQVGAKALSDRFLGEDSAVSTFLEGLSDFQRQTFQGLTANFGDEILGNIRSGDADQNIADERARNERFQEENPVLSGVAQTVGATSTALVPGAGAASLAKSAVGKIAAGATAGGVFGALSGAGAGEDLESRIDGAITNGTFGVLLGGGFAAAGQAAQPIVRKVAGFFRSDRGQKITKAQQAFAKALADDGVTPEGAAKQLTELGPEAILADVGGKSVKRTVRAAQSVSNKAANTIDEALTQRQAEQATRVVKEINKELSDGQEFFAAIDDIHHQRAASAAPLYDAAYQIDIPINGKLRSLMQTSAMKTAAKTAIRDISNEVDDAGRALNIPAPQLFDRKGDLNLPDRVSTQFMDLVKRKLDDAIGAAKRSGVDDKARTLTRLKNAFIDVVDEANPAFKEARRVYAGFADSEEALTLGRAFRKDDAEIITRRLAQEGPDSNFATFYRSGVAQRIREEIQKTGDNRNVVQKIFGNEFARRQIRASFKSKEGFDAFKKAMEAEEAFVKTRNFLARQSETTDKAFEAAGLVQSLGKGTSDVLTGDVRSGVSTIVRGFTDQLRTTSPQAADELAEILTTNDKQVQAAVLRALVQEAKKIRAGRNAGNIGAGVGSTAAVASGG